MLKRLTVAFAALFVLSTSAFAAGNVPGFSVTPQFDKLGKLATGCKLYVVQAGTVAAPQNAYQDTALTILQPNPMTCDATGRLPQWFVADGNIKLRLTDKNNIDLFVQDNLLVIGPSGGGGGGGGTVDPTTILATGDFKDVYNTGVLSGFVRCNGRTIGSATSGATERANADTSALFSFLWNADANLAVSGGRGASSAADFAANKTLTLPDCRNRVRASLGDMGNADAARLSLAFLGCAGTTLGCAGGGQSVALSLSELPTGITSAITANLSVSVTSANWIASNSADSTAQTNQAGGGPGFTVTNGGGGSSVSKVVSTGSTSGGGSIVSNNTSGNAHRTVQPTILVTTYIKL